MRQSKTTLKELTAAYRAVLRYGILCNAVALGLVTAPAMAEYTNVDLGAIYTDGTATSTIKYTENDNVFWNAEDITISPTSGRAITASANGSSNHYYWTAPEPTIISIGGNDTNTITISTHDDGVLAHSKGTVNLRANNTISITTDINDTGYGALWAQNSSSPGQSDGHATINVNANNIVLNALGSTGIASMSEGIVNIEGNTTINAKNVLLTRGDAETYINRSGDKTVVLNGDIDFDYANNSGTGINALVDITLNGQGSQWTGNTVISYENKPADEKLQVSDATIRLQDGAVWNATSVEDSTGDTNGRYYTALNNLTVDNGTVNIADATRGITVENLTANNLTIGGAGKMNVSNSINTINGTIDDYTAGIVLGDGVSISGDIDFAAGTADKYAAVDGATVNYTLGNLIGNVGSGSKNIQVVSEGATVDVSTARWTSENGATFLSSGSADGSITVQGFMGGIAAAADASGTVDSLQYELTTDETLTMDKSIQNEFTLTGADDASLALNSNLNVANGATLSVNNANLAGNGSLINNSTLNIKDSNIAVNVVNNGTLISDPTTYSATVTNNGYASFEDDTFTSTAILKNAGTVDLKGETTFDSGALISGSGTTNLTSGSTTHFATDGTTNTTNVTLASGADFTGTLGGSGTLDTRNGTIDNISGSVSGGRLYMDANALSGARDTFTGTGGASGATVAAINLSNTIGDLKNGYGTNGPVTIDMGATVNDNTEIQGNNYYTQVTANGTSVTFSDKLMNSSSVHNQLGDWGQTTAGHYIGTSTAYDTDTNSYSTTNGTTVGAALTALDNQVYTNVQAIDTINNSDVMNSGIDATKVAQITTNQNDIATLTGRVDTLQGGENVSGSVRNTVKTATTMTRNPGDDEYNNFHDGDSVVRAVTELDRNMGTIHGLVGNANTTTTTTGKDYKGNLAVGTTVEDHLVALDNHIGDMRDFNTTNTYATSTESVAMNLKALDKAIADQSALALGSANAYTDARIDKLDKDLSAGIASAVALSAVATTGVQKGEVAVSGGYGYHNGQSAAAFGAAMGLSNRWSVNAGAGLSNADVSFRAGTSYKFKLF